MPQEERNKSRLRQSPPGSVRPRTSLTQYRVLHGPMIRKYYSIGDPVRDRSASTNVLKLTLIIVLIGGLVLLVALAVKRLGH